MSYSCSLSFVHDLYRHLLILAPLLSTANSGPATLPLLGTWGLSALASTSIALRPSDD